MKSSVDTIPGQIVEYDEKTGDLLIRAHYPDWHTAIHRQYANCLIQLIDGRQMSGKQRNVCYKLIREIAGHTGNSVDWTKETLKKKFIKEEMFDGLTEDFSLSDAPMSLACEFQRFLVRFMLDYEIPTSFPLLEYVDDVHDYLYGCLAHKKCCICGKPADLHHIDRVGMGRNRNEIIHEGMEALSLCRIHHNDVHRLGESRFFQKYHIESGVILDEYLCRVYDLKRKEEIEDDEPRYSDGEIDERSGIEDDSI